MANKTAKDARDVHGKDPQLLVETIIRTRIHDSLYWKEQGFALNRKYTHSLAQQKEGKLPADVDRLMTEDIKSGVKVQPQGTSAKA